jgi:hypothetical protein
LLIIEAFPLWVPERDLGLHIRRRGDRRPVKEQKLDSYELECDQISEVPDAYLQSGYVCDFLPIETGAVRYI